MAQGQNDQDVINEYWKSSEIWMKFNFGWDSAMQNLVPWITAFFFFFLGPHQLKMRENEEKDL